MRHCARAAPSEKGAGRAEKLSDAGRAAAAGFCGLGARGAALPSSTGDMGGEMGGDATAAAGRPDGTASDAGRAASSRGLVADATPPEEAAPPADDAEAVDGAVDGAAIGAVDGAAIEAVGALTGAVVGALKGAVEKAFDEAVDGAPEKAVDGALDEAVKAADEAVEAVDGALAKAFDEAFEAVKAFKAPKAVEALDGAVGVAAAASAKSGRAICSLEDDDAPLSVRLTRPASARAGDDAPSAAGAVASTCEPERDGGEFVGSSAAATAAEAAMGVRLPLRPFGSACTRSARPERSARSAAVAPLASASNGFAARPVDSAKRRTIAASPSSTARCSGVCFCKRGTAASAAAATTRENRMSAACASAAHPMRLGEVRVGALGEQQRDHLGVACWCGEC